jgi:hypothetical protein
MRIEPKLDEVINGERGMLRGIEIALESKCLVSAITLIFSSIDSLAALNRPVNQQSTDRNAFISWVEKYIRPEKLLGCSALDIYAARCGVLHTYSSESDLSMSGRARQLIYEWQGGPKADESIPTPQESLAVKVEELHNVFRESVREFLIDLETDENTKSRVNRHLASLLCYTPWPKMSVTIAA